MSIKTGQILHDVRGFVIDRAQSAGITNLTIPNDPVYEIGNYNAVQRVPDVASDTFEVESLDVSTEIEAMVTHVDPTTVTNHQQFDFKNAIPLDIISPFRSNKNAFDIVKGIVIPYMTLSGVSYKFGVGANATQTFTFEGETPYYTPGPPKQQSYTLTAAANTTYAFSNTAQVYVEQGVNVYALSACIHNLANGLSRRLYIASDGTVGTGDFTNTTGGITVLADWSATYPAVSSVLEVTYSTAAATNYLATVNASSTVKPGAVRGKDITVKVWSGAATPVAIRWSGVQSIQADWKASLQGDQELGSPHFVAYDYDVPDVTGNIVVRSIDVTDLWTKIAEVANVATNTVSGPYSSDPLQLDIQINDPDSGLPLKGIYVPDAIINIPPVQPKVSSKLDTTFNFTSNTGQMVVYNKSRL